MFWAIKNSGEVLSKLKDRGLLISRFGFKSGICLLIAPVPVHCFSITF